MDFIIVHHCGSLGGGTISALDTFKLLKSLGYEVSLALIRPDSDTINLCKEYSVENIIDTPDLYSLNYHNASSGSLKCFIKYFVSRIHKKKWVSFFKSHKQCVFIFNSSSQSPLLKISNRIGVKSICFVRETKRLRGCPVVFVLQRKLLCYADGLFFLTEFDKEVWGKKIDTYKCVVPDLVDIKKFVNRDEQYVLKVRRNYGIPNNCKNVLYLGGISSVKGAYILLKAFSRLADRESINLIILGNVAEKLLNSSVINTLAHFHEWKIVKKCYSEIYRINKQSRKVYLLGLVSDTTVWYQMADFVVFPAHKIHQARPAYEAGYYSKPIIVPDYPQLYENIIDHYNGLYYQPDDDAELAKCIRTLCNNDILRSELGKNNHSVYQEKHTFNYARKQLQDALSVVL